jgi:lambda family phage portal protein
VQAGTDRHPQGPYPVQQLKAEFEAVQFRRRLMTWRGTSSNLNTLLSMSGTLLRNRAREAVRNQAYAGSACESFVANAVGCGIKPMPRVDDPALKDAMQKLWLDWTDEADADGLTDFYGLQALAARSMFEAGEVFLRFRPRLPIDNLSVPLQLQMIEADQVPLNHNVIGQNGRQIRCGIEFDAIGQRAAYWVMRSHPGDQTIAMPDTTPVRVPATEMLHLYHPLRPGQIRGVPWITRSLVKLWLLDQYDDAELDRKKSAAMFAGFITKIAPDADMLGETENPDPDDPHAGLAELQPGTFQALMPGEDIKFSEPADVGGSYEAFQYRNLSAVAAGMGIPYTQMTGDLRQANYSSLRAGLVEFRRRIEQFQHTTLVYQLCRPVRKRWMDEAVLSGALKIPNYRRDRRIVQQCTWLPEAFDWVDPEKDTKAELLEIAGGLKSRSQAISERGDDIEQVDAERAADKKREAALGLAQDVALALSPNQRPVLTPPEDTQQAPAETPAPAPKKKPAKGAAA